MKKIGIVALVLFATIPFFLANFVHAYVSPGKPTGHVNDFANILSVEQKTQLETVLLNFKKKSGDELAIVTVPTLGDETVESYAVALFDEWGIGEKGKDNGLLILHAPNERQIWIEVGYGLESYITDAKAGSVYRNILSPAFKKGDYIGGYMSAVTAIIDTLDGQVDAIPQDTEMSLYGFNIEWFFWAIFILIWLISILGRSKSWWLGGVFGGIAGIIISFIYGFIFTGIIWIVILAVVGLIFDFFVSKAYHSSISKGGNPPWWIVGIGRGGRGGFGGGGFVGFGGGVAVGGGGGGGY